MKTLRLGVSSYSFWQAGPNSISLQEIFIKAHDMGLLGVEILHQQLESEERSYLATLKREAFQLGLSLYNLGITQDFVWDNPERRKQNLLHSLHCIDLAHALGIPSIRINAGSWRHDDSPGLVESKGWTTPWDGFTEDDGFRWAIDGLSACLEHAKRQGVMLLLENHWGLTTSAEGMLHILETIDSPWLKAILDTGNFYFSADMYQAMRLLAPHVALAHAKTYPGGGKVFSLDLDYPRILKILQDAGFKGYLSIEMEGHEHPDSAVPKSITMLQQAWERAILLK